jgi:hypothetical protein
MVIWIALPFVTSLMERLIPSLNLWPKIALMDDMRKKGGLRRWTPFHKRYPKSNYGEVGIKHNPKEKIPTL